MKTNKIKEENERLIKKIAGILADYKFNFTQIETAEMTAERIIGIINQQAAADLINDEIKFLEELPIGNLKPANNSETLKTANAYVYIEIKERINKLKGELK